jgi:hypothetical protein
MVVVDLCLFFLCVFVRELARECLSIAPELRSEPAVAGIAEQPWALEQLLQVAEPRKMLASGRLK